MTKKRCALCLHLGAATLVGALAGGATFIPSAIAEDAPVLTRSDVLNRIRDEIAYYQLLADYYRGLSGKKAMDSEHPLSTPASLRDPAISGTRQPVSGNCNPDWFDFNVTSAEIRLVNTGDTTVKRSFGLRFPLPGLSDTSVAEAGASGSQEVMGQTSDDLKVIFNPDPHELEKGLHPLAGQTAVPSPPSDIYPDALRCSNLRYHQQLRKNSTNPSAQKASAQVQAEIDECRKIQDDNVAKSAKTKSVAVPKESEEISAGIRKGAATPLVDHILSWRESLIGFA